MTRQQCSRLRLDGVVPTDVCTRNWDTRGFTVIGPAGSVAMGGVLGEPVAYRSGWWLPVSGTASYRRHRAKRWSPVLRQPSAQPFWPSLYQ